MQNPASVLISSKEMEDMQESFKPPIPLDP
jgi:hypothetical protein